jgi:peptidyl-prolyl cis-trans isomerase D
MFHLFRSKSPFMRYALVGLLILIALSMVAYLVPTGNDSTSPQAVIATVGDMEITQQEFANMINRQMQQGQLSADNLQFFVPQFMNRLLGEYAAVYEAKRLGLRATDQEMADEIQMTIPQVFQGGKFIGQEAYGQFLGQNGLTVAAFEDTIRRQILLRKLQGLAFEGSVVSPKEVESAFKVKNAKVRLRYVKFTPDEYKAKVAVAPKDISDYYEKNKIAYSGPIKRAFEALVVDEVKLGEGVTVSDETLRQNYASQMDRWKTAEEISARHILLDFNKDPANKAKLKAKADDILKQLKGGADFAALANKESQDPGSNTRGGDLGSFKRGVMDKTFEDTAFGLKANEISKVIETPFGYHIIQTTAKTPSRTQAFEEVKATLSTELKRAQVFERMPALIEQARRELTANPTSAAAIAQKLGLSYAKVAAGAAGEAIPGIGASTEFGNAIQAQAKGGITDVVQLDQSRLGIAIVNEVLPQTPQPLAEVQGQIRDLLVGQKSSQLAAAAATAFENKLNTNGRDLDKAAADTGTKVYTSDLVDRQSNIEGVGGVNGFLEIFELPLNGVHGVRRQGPSAYAFKVIEHREADLAELPNQRETIVAQLRDSKGAARRELFEDGLVDRLRTKGDLKVNQDVLNTLLQSFGGKAPGA